MLWNDVSTTIEEAQNRGTLSVPTIRLAISVSQLVNSVASRLAKVETEARRAQLDLRDRTMCILASDPPSGTDSVSAVRSTTLPFTWVKPLLAFTLDNICSPYPCADQKRELLEQCATAGWTSITQRKLEDWMNMARIKMGYTILLKSDIFKEDRLLLSKYIHRVLFGGAAAREGIPPGIIRRIEMMQQWVLNQHESRAAKDQTSSWARDVVDLVQRLSVPDDVGSDAVSDDDELDFYSDDESDSGSDTLYSDTDVEDDPDVLPSSVLGAKRKYDGLGLGRPPSRMVSRSSSNSSLSSHGTLADLPVCDALVPSSTPTESTDDYDGARPAKRRRSSLDDSSEERASPTPTAIADSPPAKPKLFEHSYRSQKRKRSSTEDDSSAFPAKRVKHIAAPPCAQVASADLDVFDSICQLDWDASCAKAELLDDVDLSAFPVDTPSLDIESCPDHLLAMVAACCEPPNELPSTLHLDTSFAWSKLQVYALERMLRHGVHVVPSHDLTAVKLTPSIALDASSFNPEELAYLCSLSMESSGAGEAFMDPPDLGPGLGVQDTNGLLQPADASLPALTDGSMLPSAEVDFDEWYASILSTPLVA
uniref:HD1-2 homeodomain protein n=1 Tax=Auricularia auricula-judae TaxID=29892 RepID=A0A6G8IXN1_AURAJ|nr:HD1-2 homeodomain protein [Auricularia auricula-judae]QKI37333.1 homeodomain protein HD1 [Auricularia auricula-judae]